MSPAQAQPPPPQRASALAILGANLAFMAVYFAAGKFGLSLAFVHASASAVWPPTGLSLAVLLLWGPRLWPAVLVGAFLVNLTTQGSVATSCGIALGNTLEAVLGAALVRQFAGGPLAFQRVGNIFRYVLLAGLVSTALSPTVGISSLCLGHFAPWHQFGHIWLTWWLGDLISNLLLAPLLLIWRTQGPVHWTPPRALEAAGVLFTLLVSSSLLFLGVTRLSTGGYPVEFLAIPPLLWAAFRFDQRGAITGAALLATIALWGTRHGFGPFVHPDPNLSLLLLQTFLGTVTLTALVLASLNGEWHQAQEAARQARDQLAGANAALEQTVQRRTASLREMISELEHFSYALVHDLRAPLRAMQSFAILAEEEVRPTASAELLDYLQRIRASAGRLDALVRDALSYNQAVLAPPQLQAVDLAQLLPSLLASYPNLQPPHAEICLEHPLPVVLGNVSGLTQCFSNLLGNAVKFVAPGVHPRVRVWAEASPPGPASHESFPSAPNSTHRSTAAAWVRIWVEDNGIGVSPQWQGRIFDMFQRANPGYDGTGIGLAIVRKVTERMCGRAGVESIPGQGSRFWVELQVAQPGSIEANRREQRAAPAKSPTPG